MHKLIMHSMYKQGHHRHYIEKRGGGRENTPGFLISLLTKKEYWSFWKKTGLLIFFKKSTTLVNKIIGVPCF